METLKREVHSPLCVELDAEIALKKARQNLDKLRMKKEIEDLAADGDLAVHEVRHLIGQLGLPCFKAA